MPNQIWGSSSLAEELNSQMLCNFVTSEMKLLLVYNWVGRHHLGAMICCSQHYSFVTAWHHAKSILHVCKHHSVALLHVACNVELLGLPGCKAWPKHCTSLWGPLKYRQITLWSWICVLESSGNPSTTAIVSWLAYTSYSKGYRYHIYTPWLQTARNLHMRALQAYTAITAYTASSKPTE